MASSATSPGLADELTHFVVAANLDWVGPGGGIEGESIVVHEVAMADVEGWLAARAQEGLAIAANLYAGLYFARLRWG